MTDNWDSYLIEVDRKPASLLVDLGAVVRAPMPEFPYLGLVRLILRDPDDNGFTRREEDAVLLRMEDVLETELTAGDAAVYVGRCTTAGRRDLFFYAARPDGWEERVVGALRAFSGYEPIAAIQLESDWCTYLEALYPDPFAMNGIQNRRICEQMRRQGDDLTKSRLLEHWLSFGDRQACEAFCREVATLGYVVAEISEACTDDFSSLAVSVDCGWRVRLTRPDAPADIDAISFSLLEIAWNYGGDYNGWGGPVLTVTE